ncbi:pilus assembly protein TadB [Pseudolysinimonas yzui]|uniref:Pilus assembly protein TadB n=1 Tax=Pseudolysinimonas yzui TaxID=2708254 RepID=A0A8J3DTP8_9MICO|nr:pilus assembly protein TadB [Pseudolysinimonas yzui]
MTPLIAVAVPVGVTLGLGLWTLLGLVPRVGATRLATRVAPYIADVSPEAREFLDRRPAEPLPFVGGLLAPAGRRIRSALVAVFGGDDSVERRLRQAGWSLTVEALRGRQLLGGVAGAGIGILFAVALARSSAVSPLLLGVVVAVCAAIGVLAPDQLLSRAARARRDRIAAELPTVLEFLTLSLSAGEAVLDALRRVARAGNGDLAREIAIVVAQVNAGVPLAVALERCADEIQLPALSRTVDQLVGALDRGTPLVDVLRAQAQDSRDDAKRSLLEAAGKKEIAMLVPLVFLILPVTVAFAIFPGVMVLQLGF